jgi:hypothetical protein
MPSRDPYAYTFDNPAKTIDEFVSKLGMTRYALDWRQLKIPGRVRGPLHRLGFSAYSDEPSQLLALMA